MHSLLDDAVDSPETQKQARIEIKPVDFLLCIYCSFAWFLGRIKEYKLKRFNEIEDSR